MNKEKMIELLKSLKQNEFKVKELEREISILQNKTIVYDYRVTSVFGINEDIRSKNKISDKVVNAIIKAERRRRKNTS